MSAGTRGVLGVAALAVLLPLAACGQRGALYLPTDPAASQRATLPQTVIPGMRPETPARNDAQPSRNDTNVPAAGVGAPAGGTP